MISTEDSTVLFMYLIVDRTGVEPAFAPLDRVATTPNAACPNPWLPTLVFPITLTGVPFRAPFISYLSFLEFIYSGSIDHGNRFGLVIRKREDSNLWNGMTVRLFSKQVHSSTLPRFHGMFIGVSGYAR